MHINPIVLLENMDSEYDEDMWTNQSNSIDNMWTNENNSTNDSWNNRTMEYSFLDFILTLDAVTIFLTILFVIMDFMTIVRHNLN